jgi:hypothetical protein
MSGSARKTIRDAMYDLLSLVTPPFATTGKQITVPSNVENYDMPALFIVKPEENVVESQVYGLQRIDMMLHAVMYLRKSGTPDDETNPIEDQIDDLLDQILGQPGSHTTGVMNTKNPNGTVKAIGEAQTLGGLVADVRVHGKIFIDSGVIGTLCVVEIPFAVVTGI